jgi:hypothetical protein
MNKQDSDIVLAMEAELGESVRIEPCGKSGYSLLTGRTSGRKFTAAYSEQPMQMHSKHQTTGAYTKKGRFLVEAENMRALAEKGFDVPAISHFADNFIIMPWLGENLRLDDSVMSGSDRLDGIVLGMMERLAAVHSLPADTIPCTTACTADNLEFKLNGTILEIIKESDYAIARKVRGDRSYARLCELVREAGQVEVAKCLTKGETYNPENVFWDGERLSLTDYRMAGMGDAFMDIVNPVSWGLPADADEAIAKKRQRVRRYLRARNITDERTAFHEFDHFTIGDAFNMMDVLLGGDTEVKNEKRKALFGLAHRNMEVLTSGDPELDEIRTILLRSVPELDQHGVARWNS